MVHCYKCAFKHVYAAKRVYYELRHGYASDPVHIAWFVAEMSCATDHLSEQQPDMAESLRLDRLKVFDEMVSFPGPVIFSPDFDGYIKEIFKLIVNIDKNKGGV